MLFKDKPALTHIHYIAIVMLSMLVLITYDIPFLMKESTIVNLDVEYIESEKLYVNNTDFGVSEEEYWLGLHMKEVAKRIQKTYSNTDYPEVLRVVQLVYEHAPRNGLSPDLVLAIIATESSFNKGAQSGAGAKGYMQIIPHWHQDKLKGRSVWDTAVNIEVGTAYLAECIETRGSLRGGLARYNGAISPDKVEAYNNSVGTNRVAAKRWVASL